MKIPIAHMISLTLGLLLWADPKTQETIKDFTGADPASLGVKPVTAKEDPKTQFVVGGKNPTALILSLKEINGRTIADLEKDMRPGAGSEVGSTKGFLGKDESLLEVLAADNKFVVEKSGKTHQEMAKHMHLLGAIGGKVKQEEFLYHGRRFRVKMNVTRDYQFSPFYDVTRTNADVVVKNLDNGKEFEYSLLVPEMVERYGFCEGKGTPYRVDPAKLLEVFDFLGEKKP